MSYQEEQPIQLLSPYIDSYWFFQNTDKKTREMLILPDCCMDIIYDLKNDKIFVCGVMTTAQTVSIQHGQRFFGIRFNPGVLPVILGVSATDLRNQNIPLAQANKQIHKKLVSLFNVDSPKEMSRLCNAIFEQEINRANTAEKMFFHEQTMNNTEYTVKKLSQEMKVSIRQLERLFSRFVGISPKHFLKIKRFQNFHTNLQNQKVGLASLSLQCGYADQSHMNKEYKQLTSATPTSKNMSHFYKN